MAIKSINDNSTPRYIANSSSNNRVARKVAVKITLSDLLYVNVFLIFLKSMRLYATRRITPAIAARGKYEISGATKNTIAIRKSAARIADKGVLAPDSKLTPDLVKDPEDA